MEIKGVSAGCVMVVIYRRYESKKGVRDSGVLVMVVVIGEAI